MKRIEFPVCDVRPYDSFERYKSQRTGSFLVYRYRRHRGASYDDATLVATFGNQADATKCRNWYRKQEENLRTSYEYDERRRNWPALDVAQRMEASA